MFPIGSSCNSNSPGRAGARHPSQPPTLLQPHRSHVRRINHTDTFRAAHSLQTRHQVHRSLSLPHRRATLPAPRASSPGAAPQAASTEPGPPLALQPWGRCQSRSRSEGVRGKGHLLSEGAAVPKPNASWLTNSLVFGHKEPKVGQRQLILLIFFF